MIMVIWYISYEIHKTVEKEDDILVKFLILSKMHMNIAIVQCTQKVLSIHKIVFISSSNSTVFCVLLYQAL